jgi:prepilin-type processing-associated H-X9-DG protein
MWRGDTNFLKDTLVLEDFDYTVGYGPAPGGGISYPAMQIAVGSQFIRDINNPGNDAEADSAIPVIFDSVSQTGLIRMNHLPLGGNVLYLDGHVEFQRYRQTFSQTETPIGGTIFTQNRLPYTTDFIDFLRANVWDNSTLMGIPPWCGNRLPGTPFEPRYLYYPNDDMYDDLNFVGAGV